MTWVKNVRGGVRLIYHKCLIFLLSTTRKKSGSKDFTVYRNNQGQYHKYIKNI